MVRIHSPRPILSGLDAINGGRPHSLTTQVQAQAVLNTINIRDKNASRGIRGATWLQNRPGREIVLNPAQVSRAVKLARCFCSKVGLSGRKPQIRKVDLAVVPKSSVKVVACERWQVVNLSRPVSRYRGGPNQ